jgi:hypothetical protein
MAYSGKQKECPIFRTLTNIGHMSWAHGLKKCFTEILYGSALDCRLSGQDLEIEFLCCFFHRKN